MASRYGLEIRAATESDAEGLAELAASIGRPLAPTTLAERVGAIRAEGRGVVLLALEWGPPSGVVALSWARVLSADLPVAALDVLAVAPEARRRGIARTLLKAAAQAARAAGCGSLAVTTADDTLRAFCAATGFEAVGETFLRALRKTRRHEPEV